VLIEANALRLADGDGSHLTWTIPPAVLMTAFYWPFFTRYDYYKIGFLVTVSFHSAL
jgi:15-cis-phytoene synthase/lycopene beta-cyclase